MVQGDVLARANFARAGLAPWITIHEGIALETLAALDDPFDLVFLDADRATYLGTPTCSCPG